MGSLLYKYCTIHVASFLCGGRHHREERSYYGMNPTICTLIISGDYDANCLDSFRDDDIAYVRQVLLLWTGEVYMLEVNSFLWKYVRSRLTKMFIIFHFSLGKFGESGLELLCICIAGCKYCWSIWSIHPVRQCSIIQ